MNNTISEKDTFISLLEANVRMMPKERSIVAGKIVQILDEFVFVEVGLKSEGRISKTEFKNCSNEIEIGQEIKVYIEKLEDRSGAVKLSYEKVALELAWQKCENSQSNNSNVEGVIIGKVNKGGFAVNIDNILAFLPGSQLDIRQVKDPTTMYRIKQEFRVLKLDRPQGNIVVSRRAVIEESRKEARNNLLSDIKEGVIFEGIVKNITHYGAFVDLGDIDGLLHITDICWDKITHPTEKLTLGEKIKVVVTRFNAETQRVSLGMKQLLENPWKDMDQKFLVGQKYQGLIKELSDHGIIVELAPNIRGLVYLNEISWQRKDVNDFRNIFQIEDTCEVMVLSIDTVKHRLSLSIKKCVENPWNSLLEQYPVNTEVKATVNTILDFGLLVNVINSDNTLNELSVLVPAIEINWEENPKEALKSFKVGDEINGIILDANLEKEKIKISIKRLEEKKSRKTIARFIQSGTPITCTILKTITNGLLVNTIDGNIKGLIKKYDLSMHADQQSLDRFTIGDRIDAKAISFNKIDKILNLSVRALEISDEKRAIARFGSSSSGASLGDILGPAMEEYNNK